MTRLCALAILLALTTSQADRKSATHVSAADVRATIQRAPATSVSDQQIRMVDAGGYHVGVGVVQRPQSARQGAIVHDALTEVYYVLEGNGTLVTGGTLVDPKPVPPDSAISRELTGPSSTGTAVEAGESRAVAAGDVVIVPAGVPHWFSRVEGTLRYLVVRVDPDRLLATK